KKLLQYGKLIYICNPITKGRVAQLVQSTWFTPRGSGVRIPSRPQLFKFLCNWISNISRIEVYQAFKTKAFLLNLKLTATCTLHLDFLTHELTQEIFLCQ